MVSLISVPLAQAMQLPVGRQNQLQSDANAQKYQNQPYFTLAVLQPATGYTSLEAHVNDRLTDIKNAGYGLVPPKDWHLSVMIFAIPFPKGKIDRAYAQEALETLEAILRQGWSQVVNAGILQAVTDVTFEYKDLKTIGNHKFLVANFERKQGTKPFFRVYGDIARSFFDIYPDSWMYYGYGMMPHISVASKMKAAGAPGATQIPQHPKQPIQDIKLRHQGKAYQRKLFITARWFDPATKQMDEIQSQAI